MKKTLLIFIVLLFSLEGNTQEKSSKRSIPENLLDIGFGLGSNYGIIGTKAVIGVKGSGLLIGVGRFNGFTTFSIGAQFTYEWFFVSISYGPTGVYRVEFNGEVDEGLTESVVFITGGRINLIPNKRLFLELGVGFTGSDDIPGGPFGSQESGGGVTANIGLGYRIGILD